MSADDGSINSDGTTLLGTVVRPRVTVVTGTFTPCERMFMLPVPGGTVNVTLVPVVCDPSAMAGNAGGRTGLTCAASQGGVGALGGPAREVATTTCGEP